MLRFLNYRRNASSSYFKIPLIFRMALIKKTTEKIVFIPGGLNLYNYENQCAYFEEIIEVPYDQDIPFLEYN